MTACTRHAQATESYPKQKSLLAMDSSSEGKGTQVSPHPSGCHTSKNIWVAQTGLDGWGWVGWTCSGVGSKGEWIRKVGGRGADDQNMLLQNSQRTIKNIYRSKEVMKRNEIK